MQEVYLDLCLSWPSFKVDAWLVTRSEYGSLCCYPPFFFLKKKDITAVLTSLLYVTTENDFKAGYRRARVANCSW